MQFVDAKNRALWLKTQRVNSGHTTRSFARELGLAESTIRRLEAGDVLLPPAAKLVADFYGLQVTDLFPLEDAA